MAINNKILAFFLLLTCFQISAQNDPPVLTASARQVFCPQSSINTAPNFTIVDSDDLGIESFSMQISSGYQQGFDRLSLSGYPLINSVWNDVEGKLILTSASGGEILYTSLQNAVRAIIFTTTATTITDEKFFSLTIGDANYLPSTDHFYEYIANLGITWSAARTAAEARTYFGRQGYLATLTSQEEAQFAGERVGGAGWIGGSDASTPDVWKWVAGPEAGITFWNGGVNGSSPNFAFWNTNEPNNFQNRNEDFVHITAPNVGTPGSWNDLTNTGDASGDFQPKGYVVEYGGLPNEPALSIVATTSIYLPRIIQATGDVTCSGSTANLSASSNFGNVLWYDSLTSTTVLSNQNNYTTAPLMINTTYYVSAAENICASIPRTPVIVSVTPIPTVITTSEDAVCSGETAQLSATVSSGAVQWFATNMSTTVLFTGENYTTSILTATTTYYVSAIDNTCVSVTRTPVIAYVKPNPTITNISEAAVCSGEVAQLSATASLGAVQWFASNTDTTVLFTGENYTTPALTATTTYYAAAIEDACNSVTRTPVIATVILNPTITNISEASVCSGEMAQLNATTSAGIIQWFATNTDATVLSTGENYSTPVLTTTTTFYVMVIDGSCSSTTRTPVVATVIEIPTITTIGEAAVCSGETAQLSATASLGVVQWFATNTGTAVLFTGENYTTPILTETTTYYVSARVGSCISVARTPVTVNVDATTPEFDVAQNTYILCKEIGTITLVTTNPQANNYQYVWKKDNNIFAGDAASITVDSAGNYSVKAISLTGCESVEKIMVVIDSEKATITKDDVLIIDDSDNNSLQILTSNLGLGNYVFSLDDEFGIYTSTPFFDSISTGNHTLYIKDLLGCGTVSYVFLILKYPAFFTPNEDGVNDFWHIKGYNKDFYTYSDIYIFNRFGALLYTINTNSLGWDGKYQGEILPSNSYWFRTILTDNNGLKIEKTGSFSLVR